MINKSFFLTVSKKQLVCLLTLGHTRKLIPPPWYKGGGGGGAGGNPSPGFFAVLQYLGKNLRLTDSLSCGLQCKVNIMGYCTAVTSLKMAATMAPILNFTKKFKLIGKT